MAAGRDKSGQVGTSDCNHGGFEGPSNGRVGKKHRRCLWNLRFRPGKFSSREHGRGLSTVEYTFIQKR